VKALPLIAVAGLASLVLAAPSGIASGGCAPRASSGHTARLTIKFLHIVDKPIGTRACGLAYGPIWDLAYKTRPGMGTTMVIDAHDVTPVPGYGAHGPFYRLYLLKPGELATIRWKGVRYTYRFSMKPFARRQCLSKRVNDLPARLAGKLMCVGYDKPIKSLRVEGFYIRCCWPRYTREKYLYERAVLIRTTPIS
jgi:hypothetical protein